jgi:hypothetical protein
MQRSDVNKGRSNILASQCVLDNATPPNTPPTSTAHRKHSPQALVGAGLRLLHTMRHSLRQVSSTHMTTAATMHSSTEPALPTTRRSHPAWYPGSCQYPGWWSRRLSDTCLSRICDRTDGLRHRQLLPWADTVDQSYRLRRTTWTGAVVQDTMTTTRHHLSTKLLTRPALTMWLTGGHEECMERRQVSRENRPDMSSSSLHPFRRA